MAVVGLFLIFFCIIENANAGRKFGDKLGLRRMRRNDEVPFFKCNACPASSGYTQFGCCNDDSKCPVGSTCINSACCGIIPLSTNSWLGTIMALEDLEQEEYQCGACPAEGGYVQVGCCAHGCPPIAACIHGACCTVIEEFFNIGQRISHRQPTPSEQFRKSSSNVALCPGGIATTVPCIKQSCPDSQACINNFCCPVIPPGSLGAICPNGAPSISTCINNSCPNNQVCISNFCCPNKASFLSTVCPTGPISSVPCTNGMCSIAGFICVRNFCCPTIAAVTSVCPNGAISSTPCTNGGCLSSTQSCFNNFCCENVRPLAGTGMCPSGVLSNMPCMNGACVNGASCVNNFCC